MSQCCAVGPVHADQRRVLRSVLVVNAAMFVVQLVAAARAGSTALLADSADMLGDAMVYAMSLYALGRDAVWQTRVARPRGESWRRSGRASWWRSRRSSCAASSRALP